MPARKTDAETLAALCAAGRAKLLAAGRALHDDVGPLVSAAGLKLQLLREDAPAAAEGVNEVLGILEQAVERVRRVSQDLHPAPAARLGLKTALASLAADGRVSVTCAVTAALPEAIVAPLYETAAAAVDAALRSGATRVTVSAAGSTSVSIRVADDGRAAGRSRSLSVPGLIARHAGLSVTIATGRSTIVWIRYAVRRTARR